MLGIVCGLLGCMCCISQPRCKLVFEGRWQPMDTEAVPAKEMETACLLGEAPHAYSRRMGKWATQVVEALESPSWWLSMTINHLCRSPIDRLMKWLQSRSQGEPGLQGEDSLPPVVDFVTTRCSRLFEDLEELLGAAAWESDAVWRLAERAGGERRAWREAALGTLVAVAADLFRRIVLPTQQWPMRLCWLVAAPADEEDAKRAAVCADLVRQPPESPGDGKVDSLTSHVRAAWYAELAEAASANGRICAALHSFLDAVPPPQDQLAEQRNHLGQACHRWSPLPMRGDSLPPSALTATLPPSMLGLRVPFAAPPHNEQRGQPSGSRHHGAATSPGTSLVEECRIQEFASLAFPTLLSIVPLARRRASFPGACTRRGAGSGSWTTNYANHYILRFDSKSPARQVSA